ncbi:MAG: hypothetical protein IPG17_24865 [Sandaracinaceae bacterium]|nr:hypothetical protein [Sandaracinaceae bacterium]
MDLRDDQPRSPLSLRERFRAFVADELRYKRFLLQLEENSELMWWQERLWEQFVAAEGISLSADYQVVAPIFAGALAEVMPRHELAEEDVPAWCSITALEGSAPVQGWGTCRGHAWYFRARWGDWEVIVSEGTTNGGDGPAVFDLDSASAFRRDGGYGDERYDASYMPVAEARYFIVSALREFMDERLGSS